MHAKAGFRPWDIAWIKRYPARMFAFVLLCSAGVFALSLLLRQPSHDRDWRAEIAIMPKIERSRTHISIDQVRDWTYSTSDIVTDAYHPGTYDLNELVGTWLMVEPFGGSDAIAHTLILFEFTDDRLLALTIEARKEKGEIYSALKGAFNTYELVYLWAEARDVLTRRARYLDHEIFVYPLNLNPEERLAFIGALADKTNKLYEKPRFYNTLFSNCTNELAKTAGLTWNLAFITTGYAPQHLFRTGMIPGRADDIGFQDTKSAANVTELIETVSDDTLDAFNAAFLEGLRARF